MTGLLKIEATWTVLNENSMMRASFLSYKHLSHGAKSKGLRLVQQLTWLLLFNCSQVHAASNMKELSQKRRVSPLCQIAVIAQSVEHWTLDQKIMGRATAGEIKIFHFLFRVVCVISTAGDVHSSSNLCINTVAPPFSW